MNGIVSASKYKLLQAHQGAYGQERLNGRWPRYKLAALACGPLEKEEKSPASPQAKYQIGGLYQLPEARYGLLRYMKYIPIVVFHGEGNNNTAQE